jgi:hypothetical protein
VAKRKRSRPPRQPPEFKQHSIRWGWTPEADSDIANWLEAYRVTSKGGKHGAAGLRALLLCLLCDYKPPRWVRGYGIKSIERFLAHKVRTLGEAFNVPPHAGSHLDEYQEREDLRWYVVVRVEQLRRSRPINEDLFAKVAGEIGKGTSYVSGIWRAKASHPLRKIIRNLRIS